MENVEMINILNLVVILSIPIISFNIYNIKEDSKLINVFLLSIFEIVMNLLLMKSDKFSYGIILIFTLKSVIFLPNYFNIISICIMFTFFLKGNFVAYILNLLLNIYLSKIIIIDKIKGVNKLYIENKQRLKENIKHKERLKELGSENLAKQQEYTDYIKNINYKIEKAIKTSEVPIFLIDYNKNLLSYNKSFENILDRDLIDIEKFELEKYLEYKFINYQEAIDKIKDISISESINLETINKKIYKFTCTPDIIGNKLVIICTLKDITQSTLIQNKLFDSEQRYKKLMDVLDEGVIISSRDKIDYINDKGISLFNLEKEELNITNLINSSNFKFRKELEKKLIEVEENEDVRLNIKIETKNNKVLELILVNMKVYDKNYVITIAIDVTKLENTLSKIKESEKTYKLLLQTLPEGIIILDKINYYETYKNESSNELLKVIGKDNLNLYIKRYIKDNEFGIFKKFIIDEDKNLDIALAIIDREEENKYIVVFRTLDYEYKINKIKEELKTVEKDNKFKTDLMVSIANDIKNPLQKVDESKNNIAKLENSSEHIANYTNLVYQNTNRLKRLVNNINEVSLDRKHIEIDKSLCSIVELVKNIIDKSNDYISENNLNCSFINNIKNDIVNIDIDKVERIILNILSNSIKYTKKGQIEIILNEYEDEIGVNIKDTGVGIPKDRLDTIFMDFSQVDTTLSRGCEGTGVGLAVVKKLADAHNLTIKVESIEGKGSNFEILIPKSKSDKVYNSDDIFADKEKVDIEYSDIYFNV